MNLQGSGGYAVGWITLSFINAGLAQAKGLDGGLWWLASIFLGPVATFLIVIQPPSTPPGERSDKSSGGA